MKLKIPTGAGGVQQILANHLEKILIGIALALGALLVYSGFRDRVGIPGDKSPAHLNQEISSASRHIDGFQWTEHFRGERVRDERFLERADDAIKTVDVAGYAISQNVKPPYTPPRGMRDDPALYPPRDLEVHAGFGTLAMRAGGSADQRGPDRRAPPAARRVRVSGGPMRGGPDSVVDDFVKPNNGAIPQGVHFVSVTALVPYREQLQQYLDILAGTDGYNQTRDQPNYVNWVLERAEVQSEGETPQQWKQVGYLGKVNWEAGRWNGSVADDFVLGDFDDPVLTSRMPPIKGAGGFDDWMRFAAHSKLPTEVAEDPPDGEDESTQPTDQETPDFFGAANSDTSAARPSSGSRATENESLAVKNPRRRRGAEGTDEGRDSDDLTEPEQVPEFKLFRYFDVSVKPGKMYRYQLKLYIEDPNNPRDDSVKPLPTTLEQSVAERIAALKPRADKTRVYYRITDYGEPSPVVRVPHGRRLIAGEVRPAEKSRTRQGNREFVKPGQETSARVVAFSFDPRRGATLATQADVQRGSFGNFQGVTAQMRTHIGGLAEVMEDQEVRTGQLVVDIRGGDIIGETDLTEPGEILVWDSSGNVAVLDELSDAADYRRLSFELAEEEDTRRRVNDQGKGGEEREDRGEGNILLEGRPSRQR